MERELSKVMSVGLILLGITHTVLTPLFYSVFDVDAVWFAGSGLGFIYLGSYNLKRRLDTSKLSSLLTAVCNLLALLWLSAFLYLERTLSPQGLVSMLILGILFLTTSREFLKQNN